MNPKSSTLALLLAAPTAAFAQTTVFSDDFSTSTLNGGSVPTATSTSYDIASTKNTTASTIGTGALSLTFPSTSSGFAEAQAIFTQSPVTLAATGHYIEYTVTFQNTSGLLPAGTSFLAFGLFNSGGSLPVAGLLNNGGLSATADPTYATGFAAGWQGYVARVAGNSGSSTLITRPAQVGETSSEAQDLIGSNVGGGAFDNPGGTTLSSQASSASLTVGNTYTAQFRLTYDLDAASITVANTLYDGVGTGGSVLSSQTGTANGSTLLTTTFDALTFGDRSATTGSANTMTVSAINVVTNVPEPGSASLLVIGAASMGALLRRRSVRR